MAEQFDDPGGAAFPDYAPSPAQPSPVAAATTTKKKSPPHKRTRDASALRKAPQAPKRFKSSYICFFMAKQPEIKQELGPKASVSEVSKRSAEIWRSLPANERAHWDEIAAKDKQRYMIEKSTYTGPWQVPWKRAKKDPTAPKRPMSAFLYFSQERRRQIKQENPDLRNTEISRMLGKLWREAPEDVRAPHIAKEKEEREKYKIRIEKWRSEHDERMEEQRKIQAEQAAHAAAVYGQANSPEDAESGEQPQYNFTNASGGPAGYEQGGYMPQQQMYGYPQQGQYPGYATMPYGYNPSMPQGQYNVRQAVVLGPNGMPHYYQSQYGGGQQVDQSQGYEGGVQHPQASYDYGDKE